MAALLQQQIHYIGSGPGLQLPRWVPCSGLALGCGKKGHRGPSGAAARSSVFSLWQRGEESGPGVWGCPGDYSPHKPMVRPQDPCTIQVSKAQNTLLMGTATHLGPSPVTRPQLHCQPGRPVPSGNWLWTQEVPG